MAFAKRFFVRADNIVALTLRRLALLQRAVEDQVLRVLKAFGQD
jgi:hypothetical protein